MATRQRTTSRRARARRRHVHRRSTTRKEQQQARERRSLMETPSTTLDNCSPELGEVQNELRGKMSGTGREDARGVGADQGLALVAVVARALGVSRQCCYWLVRGPSRAVSRQPVNSGVTTSGVGTTCMLRVYVIVMEPSPPALVPPLLAGAYVVPDGPRLPPAPPPAPVPLPSGQPMTPPPPPPYPPPPPPPPAVLKPSQLVPVALPPVPVPRPPAPPLPPPPLPPLPPYPFAPIPAGLASPPAPPVPPEPPRPFGPGVGPPPRHHCRRSRRWCYRKHRCRLPCRHRHHRHPRRRPDSNHPATRWRYYRHHRHHQYQQHPQLHPRQQTRCRHCPESPTGSW
jgi:hypothetical protein